jgi:hypothetical protein
MRRTAPVLGLVVCLLAGPLLVNALARTPPRASNVHRWLGLWETNYGKLRFFDAYRAASESPDAQGRTQYYWALDGTWTGSFKGTRAVHLGIDPRNVESAGGCGYTPAAEKNSLCGSMQLYRTRSRITSGFWNDCRLVCANHHPWHGTQKESAYLVGFRFTQRGLPDGNTTIRTQGGGAGNAVFIGDDNPDESNYKSGRATHGTQVIVIDEIPEAVDLRLGIRMEFASIDHGGPSTRLSLSGKIETSNDPHCPVGARATVRLTEGAGRAPDQVTLASTGCRKERWTSTDPSRVKVRISNARTG